MYTFKTFLYFEFVLIMLEPMYYFLIEAYEFGYSKKFHFGAFGSTHLGLEFFYASLIIIALYIPSVLNFITLKKLLV